MAKKKLQSEKTQAEKQKGYVPAGKKLAVTPKKGQPAYKPTEIVKGAKKVNMPQGPYTPKPTASAKTAAPAAKKAAPAKAKKYKAPSNKKVFGNVKTQNKRVQKRGLKKC